MTHERLTTPIARDGWKMTNLERQVQSICQALQSHFPQSATIAIAAAAVRRDHQFLGPRKALATHVFVPAADAVGREMGCIMINADADPALIVGHVINTVGNGFAQVLVLEIMDTNPLRIFLGPPFLAR